MIALSPEAEAQLDALMAHYEALGRVEASINLLNALERARTRISVQPEAGLPAPRPYPALAKTGRRWVIEGSYWISSGGEYRGGRRDEPRRGETGREGVTIFRGCYAEGRSA